jgi:hypothetical protein
MRLVTLFEKLCKETRETTVDASAGTVLDAVRHAAVVAPSRLADMAPLLWSDALSDNLLYGSEKRGAGAYAAGPALAGWAGADDVRCHGQVVVDVTERWSLPALVLSSARARTLVLFVPNCPLGAVEADLFTQVRPTSFEDNHHGVEGAADAFAERSAVVAHIRDAGAPAMLAEFQTNNYHVWRNGVAPWLRVRHAVLRAASGSGSGSGPALVDAVGLPVTPLDCEVLLDTCYALQTALQTAPASRLRARPSPLPSPLQSPPPSATPLLATLATFLACASSDCGDVDERLFRADADGVGRLARDELEAVARIEAEARAGGADPRLTMAAALRDTLDGALAGAGVGNLQERLCTFDASAADAVADAARRVAARVLSGLDAHLARMELERAGVSETEPRTRMLATHLEALGRLLEPRFAIVLVEVDARGKTAAFMFRRSGSARIALDHVTRLLFCPWAHVFCSYREDRTRLYATTVGNAPETARLHHAHAISPTTERASAGADAAVAEEHAILARLARIEAHLAATPAAAPVPAPAPAPALSTTMQRLAHVASTLETLKRKR